MISSPFDRKNKLASLLDRLAACVLLLLGCIVYFYALWHSGAASLVAGIALFVLLCLTILLFERRTLTVRDRLLRERLGGAIALEELLLSPAGAAALRVRDLLCRTLGAAPSSESTMRYGKETWLIRCAQCLPGTSASQGDVLSAHRARVECGADKVALACTAGFSPEATRAAEWTDPPVRLISGRQLAMLFGRMHPATDEEIARRASRQKKPFSWQRIRALALSPGKKRRYLLCAFLLMTMYLLGGSLYSLLACLFSFLLAMLCSREGHFSL